MVVNSTDLPNYEIPPMDGIGTQEAIMDVTHGLMDFLSGCDTNPVAELNAWYHMMNCGFRMAFIGGAVIHHRRAHGRGATMCASTIDRLAIQVMRLGCEA
jgi:hypothetical protein